MKIGRFFVMRISNDSISTWYRTIEVISLHIHLLGRSSVTVPAYTTTKITKQISILSSQNRQWKNKIGFTMRYGFYPSSAGARPTRKKIENARVISKIKFKVWEWGPVWTTMTYGLYHWHFGQCAVRPVLIIDSVFSITLSWSPFCFFLLYL
jgi:hypothetical protein